MIELSNDGFDCKAVYGEELFEKENIAEAWSDGVVAFLKLWRESLPGTPELNFDLSSDAAFNELKQLDVAVFIKLLKNVEIVETYFPLIFPKKVTLQLLLGEYQNLILDDQTLPRDKNNLQEAKILLEKVLLSY